MKSKWPIVRIDDIKAESKNAITIGPFGSRMKSDCYVDSGVAVIRGTNLGSNPVFINNFVYITEEKANELASCNVYKDDLVFPHRGSIGEVGIVGGDLRYVLSSSLMKLTCDRKKAVPKFIYYFFKSSLGRHELLKNASQVGTPGIGQPLTSLKSIELPLPPLKIQKNTATTLGLLDDKIQLNHQINQTLEQIAQAIFKSWFVDFEPVKARIAALEADGSEEDALLAAMQAISGAALFDADASAAGAEEQLARLQAERPEQYAELRATAELFPSAMQDSELGEIPLEWSVGHLSELIQFNPRRSLKKGSLAPYLDMKNVPTSGHLAEDVVLRETNSGTKFINGDTLLARITPCLENGKTAYVDFLDSSQVGWGSTEYIVMRSQEPYPESISYFVARDPIFRQHAIQSMTGTSGRQRANAKALAELAWIVYPKALVKAFDRIASPYLILARSHGNESRTLSDMRDTLLPKLLAGELSVPGTKYQTVEATEEANV